MLTLLIKFQVTVFFKYCICWSLLSSEPFLICIVWLQFLIIIKNLQVTRECKPLNENCFLSCISQNHSANALHWPLLPVSWTNKRASHPSLICHTHTSVNWFSGRIWSASCGGMREVYLWNSRTWTQQTKNWRHANSVAEPVNICMQTNGSFPYHNSYSK